MEAPIARGGMATVCLAVDTRLDRTVAVKIAHPELAGDPEFVRRFIGEARSAARLSSPHVVAVYDQGSDGPVHFIVMEYVPGRSLRAMLVERGRLGPGEALDITEGVLAGLAVAHQAGLVHRDVKPENVLLTVTNGVKVADFGLARAAAATRHTKTGTIIGTAAYLAPEQVSAHTSDARCDVYAAGVMLYELLTGRQPFTGQTPLAVAYQHVEHDVPPPSALVPGLPPALDDLVALATSRDPARRPADAGQFLAAITALRRGPDPAAPQADTWPPARLPASAGGLAAVGLDPALPPPAELEPGGSAHPTRTLIVSPDDCVPGYGQPGYGQHGYGQHGYGQHGGRQGPPGAARGREPVLARWLFSRRLLYVIGVIVLAVAVGVGAWQVLGSQYGTVPHVGGETTGAARAQLRAAGYVVRLGKGRHAAAPRGRVIAAIPPIGSRVRDGSTVTIVPSLGPAEITIPSVSGQPLARAEQTLRQDGLRPLVTAPVPSATIPKGIVVRTSPVAGVRWPAARPVQVIDSAGPPLPSFAGQPLRVARARARAGGYSINPVLQARGTQPRGTIVRQSPAPGTAISRREVVTVYVSPGPPLVTVPDVRGMSAGRAVAVLRRAGFRVAVNSFLLGSRVAHYSPAGRAPAGSTITITLGLGLFPGDQGQGG